MDPIIDLGIISIHWYSIILFIAILIGSNLAIKEAKKHGFEEDFMVNLLFLAVIVGIVGARLYYVIFNFDYYKDNLIEIFKVWNGGLAIHGGIIAGLITIAVICYKRKVNLLKILDYLVVGLILAQAIGRWGNFFNSEAYGYVTSYGYLKSLYIPEFIIRGMYINGDYYMPTFFFESVWNVIGFIILLLIRKFYKNLKTGQLMGFYMMWYSFIRFIIEGMRLDSLMLGPIRVAQLVSVVLFAVGVYFVFIRRNKKLYREDVLYE